MVTESAAAKRRTSTIIVMTVLVVLLALVSLGVGPVRMSPLTVLDTLFGGGSDVYRVIVQEIRLPRTILAVAIGAILGLSGAALQGLLRNPLASPSLFGAPQAAAFGRPFYTSSDRPEVASLVHNEEHGYTIAWYDETAAADKTEMNALEAIAKKYQDDNVRFIAAPWTSSDGAAFPDGKHLALTRWTADAKNPGDQAKQRGNWQYCGSVSGQVVADFVKKWPNAESPEPGIM